MTIATPPDEEEVAELRERLGRTPPEIPSHYLYDLGGTDFFESITEQPEYYQTRTELAIVRHHADAIVARADPAELVELGPGSGKKTALLADAFARHGGRRVALVDISVAYLDEAERRVRAAAPGVEVVRVEGDLHRDLDQLGQHPRRLLVLLAGTVGNLDPAERRTFFGRVAQRIAPDGAFLLGVDLVKDPDALTAAYDDAAGVTAAFDRNILAVVNARFGADFVPDAFEHVALWNAEHRRIEMRLRASRAMTVRVADAGVRLELEPGDEILTELCHKFTRAGLAAELADVGLRVDAWYADPEERFADVLIRCEEPA